MKNENSPSGSPRFLCRAVRGALSIFGDASSGEPRGPGAAHVAACADCREFFGACDELTAALKRDATRDRREPSAALEQNILRAIRLSAPEPAPRAARTAWLSFAGMGACAVLAAVIYQKQFAPGPRGAHGPQPGLTDAAAVATAREIIAAVPTDLFDQMQPRAQAILQENPLENEVEAVKSDARSAVRFLAQNFLPNSLSQPASGD